MALMCDIPDFRALYPDDDESLSADTAAHLWSELDGLVERWVDLESDPADRRSTIQGRLPPIARLAAEDDGWLERFVECFGDLAERLASGKASQTLCRCTGDEMALHIAFDNLRSRVEDESEPWAPLAQYEISEEAISIADDYLLVDDDVLLLFLPHLDGVEDLLPDVANLQPERWFLDFHQGTAPP